MGSGCCKPSGDDVDDGQTVPLKDRRNPHANGFASYPASNPAQPRYYEDFSTTPAETFTPSPLSENSDYYIRAEDSTALQRVPRVQPKKNGSDYKPEERYSTVKVDISSYGGNPGMYGRQ
ncbi:hypothetical protein QQS21_012102 [Conoideocrella luteorostrata]|uniref:Uncharacterized protein n=1 Tax=Conoideocrella luteorostrata TaxID=1105319 RepID=A0AAJ0CBU4_9HYPO|nr:hypothetical protein QQS21_012102 [Conoideocrella luteorostrata]